MAASIQQLLEHAGYTENAKESRFERYGSYIPYSEIIGHTVGSFIEKARRKGWLPQVEKGTTGKTPSAFVVWSSLSLPPSP